MLVRPIKLTPQAIYHTTVPLISIAPQPGQRLHCGRIGTGFAMHFLNITCLPFVAELSPLAACLAVSRISYIKVYAWLRAYVEKSNDICYVDILCVLL